MPFGNKIKYCAIYHAICSDEQLRASHGWEPRLAADPPTILKERSSMPLDLVDPHFASAYQVTGQKFVIHLWLVHIQLN